MNLKKLTTVLLIAMCTSIVAPAFAGDEKTITPIEKADREARSQQAMNRLMEIKNMDKSNLTSEQKRELRKEVKAIRDDRRRNGIYLSVGAIIIIILLLILILH
jgi:hypothetical protein